MKNISLRRFRVEIVDIDEEIEVSRRDPEGNIQLLGVWMPYVTYGSNAKPLEPLGDQAPVPGGTTAIRGRYVREEQTAVPSPGVIEARRLEIPVAEPRVIRTPADAAVAVAPHPVRAVPKPSQRKVKR